MSTISPGAIGCRNGRGESPDAGFRFLFHHVSSALSSASGPGDVFLILSVVTISLPTRFESPLITSIVATPLNGFDHLAGAVGACAAAFCACAKTVVAVNTAKRNAMAGANTWRFMDTPGMS